VKSLRQTLLLSLCLLGSSAFAAGQLESLRGKAEASRAAVQAVRGEQMARRQELNQLAGRIETLKAQSKGKLVPGGELDGALKRSQELSGTLTTLAGQFAEREADAERVNLALLAELSSALESARADFDRQTDRAARKATIARLRTLRAEREQVRAAIPAARVPALEALRSSEDPEALLEQADAARDNEDKVRAQLKSTEQRIAELKEERELDRRVNQFLGDESLFDDTDRRIRVSRSTGADNSLKTTAGTPTGTERGTTADSAQSPSAFGGFGAAPGSPQGATEAPPPPTAGGSSGAPRTTAGTDARPLLNAQRIAGGDEDDLEELEVQRLKLKGLAEELKARARELEKKAAGR
jgi:hypothetical protein